MYLDCLYCCANKNKDLLNIYIFVDKVAVVPVVDLECNIKANLIDNSMVKSKIHAASRRNNVRKQPTSVGSTSNVNSSFKNSFTELSSNSLNHQRMDIYGDDEQALSILSKIFCHIFKGKEPFRQMKYKFWGFGYFFC